MHGSPKTIHCPKCKKKLLTCLNIMLTELSCSPVSSLHLQVKVGLLADVWSLGVVTWDCFSGHADRPLFWPDTKISIQKLGVGETTLRLRRRAREQLKDVKMEADTTACHLILQCLTLEQSRPNMRQVCEMVRRRGWPYEERQP